MIVIGYINGKYCPQIICDVCGAVITECKHAAVAHKRIENEEDIRKVLYVHKEFCIDVIERKLGRIGWHELSSHMTNLLENINFSNKSNGGKDKLKHAEMDEDNDR